MSPHQLLWNPITGSDGCRAGDASDHAAAPPRSVMNSRRFIRILSPRITPYHIVENPCCASQHFGPPDFRSGSGASN